MAELALVVEDRPNHTTAVIKTVAGGVVLAGAVIAPNILGLLAGQIKNSPPDKALRAARYAKQRGWITFRETARGVEVALTETGTLKWQKLTLFEPLHATHWDRQWRFVIFDIPTHLKPNAEAFRLALKKIGLKQLQKSIWITPYACQTQVAYFRQEYGIKDFVRIVEAHAIDDETSLKRLFNLT